MAQVPGHGLVRTFGERSCVSAPRASGVASAGSAAPWVRAIFGRGHRGIMKAVSAARRRTPLRRRTSPIPSFSSSLLGVSTAMRRALLLSLALLEVLIAVLLVRLGG